MGFILKIILFGVAAYFIWNKANYLFNLLGGNRRPSPPAPPPVPPQASRDNTAARPRVIEDTHPCPVCGAYVAAGVAKCGRPDCPQ